MLISSEDLNRAIDDPSVRVVDCRFNLMDPAAGHSQYLDGHLPGAVFANLDQDLAGPVETGTGRHPLPDATEFAAFLGKIGIANDTTVVVYDESSGALAARLWWMLRWAGHDAVNVLDGGLARWRALGLPTESGVVDVAAATFHAEVRPERVLDTAEILAADDVRRRLQLVDARDAARFRGDVEPIDAIAGHIPGALNLPFTCSLNDDGTWKDSSELRAMWQDLLGEGIDRPWSVMCGSGVTACHLALSGLLAGLPEPRLYVGSWSEWIADSERPIG